MAFPTERHMKLEVRFYGPGSTAAGCLLYYQHEEGDVPEVGTMAAHVDFFYDQLAPAFAACLPTACGVTQFIGTWKFGDIYLDAVSTSSPTAGTAGSSDTLPEEDSVVLQKRTNLAGRANRGRIFMPFVPESFQDEGELNTDAFTAYLNLAEALRTQQTNGTYDPAVVWNPVHANSKTTSFKRIHDVRVVRQVCNKRSRRAPKRLTVAARDFD